MYYCRILSSSILTKLLYLVLFYLQGGLQVIGKCGGRCGTCSPEAEVGLRVELEEGNLSLWNTHSYIRREGRERYKLQ